jgi:hypothetical protein
MNAPRVLKVAVLVAADVGSRDLGKGLSEAFSNGDEVLQFAVEGWGWDGEQDIKDKLLRFAQEAGA